MMGIAAAIWAIMWLIFSVSATRNARRYWAGSHLRGIARVPHAQLRQYDELAVPTGKPSPEDILAERYARGEISTDDYQERLYTLEVTRPTGGRIQ